MAISTDVRPSPGSVQGSREKRWRPSIIQNHFVSPDRFRCCPCGHFIEAHWMQDSLLSHGILCCTVWGCRSHQLGVFYSFLNSSAAPFLRISAWENWMTASLLSQRHMGIQLFLSSSIVLRQVDTWEYISKKGNLFPFIYKRLLNFWLMNDETLLILKYTLRSFTCVPPVIAYNPSAVNWRRTGNNGGHMCQSKVRKKPAAIKRKEREHLQKDKT